MAKRPEEPEVIKKPPRYENPMDRFYRDPSWLAGYYQGLSDSWREAYFHERGKNERLRRKLKTRQAGGR